MLRNASLAILLLASGCQEASVKARRGDGPTSSVRALASSAPSALRSASTSLRPIPKARVAGVQMLIDKAARQSDAMLRARLAAGILVELEVNRLPSSVLSALGAASERRIEAGPRAAKVWTAIGHHPDFLQAWNDSCRGVGVDGGSVMARGVAAEPTTRGKALHVYGLCELDRSGRVPREELSLDYDLVVLGHTLLQYLEERGGPSEQEVTAIGWLMRSGRAPSPAWHEDDFPREEKVLTVEDRDAKAIERRRSQALRLLKTNALSQFFTECVDPADFGGIAPKDAAKAFARDGRVKSFINALELGAGQPAIDEGGGEASIALPWRPGRDAPERLRFQARKSAWFLRL